MTGVALLLGVGFLAMMVHLTTRLEPEPAWTEIYVAYTEVRFVRGLWGKKRNWVHTLVIAENPHSGGRDYHTSAGESSSGSGGSSSVSGSSSCERKGQLCAVSGALSNSSKDKLREIEDYQRIGTVHLPFSEVKRLMDLAAMTVNGQRKDYELFRTNCNTYAFTFLRDWLQMAAEPDVQIPGAVSHTPGWNSGTLDKWGTLGVTAHGRARRASSN